MMTAKEAKEMALNNENINISLKMAALNQNIAIAASAGEYFCHFDQFMPSRLQEELLRLGYSIESNAKDTKYIIRWAD